MATKNPAPSGRSKVRIFFVDADLAPGDMQELTSALSSAIRPTHMIQRIPAPPKLPAPDGISNSGLDGADEVEFEELNNETEEAVEIAASRAPARPRKYPSPKPVNDLDMNAGGKSFESFAQEKGAPAEHVNRYLVAAAWLHEYAKISTVSIDHVFTCYKSAGWSLDITDPVFPFRSLKREGLGDQKGQKFTINHLGLARVEKMKPEA